MFGFMKSKEKPADAEDNQDAMSPARRTSSDPVLLADSMEDDTGKGKKKQSSASTRPSPARNRDKYKDDFRDSGGLQAQNSKTLDTLHQQGEQIERTSQMAVGMDKDLSKSVDNRKPVSAFCNILVGEKLLNNLGGVFSMPWKPKKTRDITGPVITTDDHKKDKARKEQREKLGLAPAPKKGGSKTTSEPEPTDAMQKVELEKRKQDDSLSDLDILGDLKGMAVEMGTELDRQNKALDHLVDDVDELNSRVKGANQRAKNCSTKNSCRAYQIYFHIPVLKMF
ncbi:SNAP25-like proteinous protein SNAP29 [Hibiscus syriacus]|uniref:SNAP25-like proteinous protein SNAP29 n=1 Tax=Hibiscus syriacus TaxID=106335 RepID=A0A6A3D0B7_HIBSY|nr:SNAP25-like proteinous protein SNAP29 [Hibiscus syriacus]